LETDTITTITTLINLCTNLGVLGVVFWLFIVGKLHGEGELDYLKEALETERRAHDATRHALDIETQRSQLSVLNSEILSRAFHKKEDE